MINFTKFDFNEIFGVVKMTEGMQRPQLRTYRAEIQEYAIEKYSGGQLKYVGDTEDGKDFYGVDDDNLVYESKGINGMFQTDKTDWCKEIVLKNFYSKNTGIPDQTFDYMLLWDTTTYRAAICSWDTCMKYAKVTDANVKCKINKDDITFVADNVTPVEKGDYAEKLKKLMIASI